jgi:hypothetical protein
VPHTLQLRQPLIVAELVQNDGASHTQALTERFTPLICCIVSDGQCTTNMSQASSALSDATASSTDILASKADTPDMQP